MQIGRGGAHMAAGSKIVFSVSRPVLAKVLAVFFLHRSDVLGRARLIRSSFGSSLPGNGITQRRTHPGSSGDLVEPTLAESQDNIPITASWVSRIWSSRWPVASCTPVIEATANARACRSSGHH